MTKPKTPTMPTPNELLSQVTAHHEINKGRELQELFSYLVQFLETFPEEERVEVYKLTLEYLSR